MDIIITMLGGTSLSLRVNPADTVGSLKTLIQRELRCAPESQKLTFVNGKRITLDDDSRTISSYGLHPGCQVSLLVTQPAPIQVFLRNAKGKVSTYDIKSDETVSNFRRRVESREKVQNDQFRLVHEGKHMMDGKLADYNVRQRSTIEMTLHVRGG